MSNVKPAKDRMFLEDYVDLSGLVPFAKGSIARIQLNRTGRYTVNPLIQPEVLFCQHSFESGLGGGQY